MGLPAKKYETIYSDSSFRIVENANAESKKPIFKIAILIFILSIIGAIPVILNAFDDNPGRVTLPATDIDWNSPPCSPADLSKDWKEITHHKRLMNSNRRDFIHTITGLIIAFELGDAKLQGHRKYNHWHRYNPFSKGDHDQYLDKDGKAVRRGHNNSHIKPDCK